MFRLVILGALVAFASGEATDVSKCIHNAGELPISAHIEGCTTPPCGLPQLEDAIINISFQAQRDIQSMTTLATAYMSLFGLIIPIPYPLGEQAATCDSLVDASCPVANGELLQYTLRLYIEPSFPVGTSLPIEFRIVDESNAAVVCIRVPITILGPRSGLLAGDV